MGRRRRAPLAIDVIRTPSSPQGIIHSNGCRSLSTLTANPWVVTPRATCMPIEPILRSCTHTPVKSRPSSARAARCDAVLGQRGDHRPLEQAHEGDDVVGRARSGSRRAARGRGRSPCRRGRRRRCRCPARPVPVLAERRARPARSGARACRPGDARAAAACRGSPRPGVRRARAAGGRRPRGARSGPAGRPTDPWHDHRRRHRYLGR